MHRSIVTNPEPEQELLLHYFFCAASLFALLVNGINRGFCFLNAFGVALLLV